MASLVLVAISACSAPASRSPVAANARYQGVGTYAPGILWPRIVTAAKPRSPSTATSADDEHIIVVVDGRTGEVRECGDYSGACVKLSPWAADGASTAPAAPVTLTQHLDQAIQAQKHGEGTSS